MARCLVLITNLVKENELEENQEEFPSLNRTSN